MSEYNSDSKLLEDIESAASVQIVKIWGLSGAGFVIRSGASILYVDPWLVPPDASRTTHRTYPIPFPPDTIHKACAILSTHEHEDHCNIPTIIGLNKNTGARFIGPVSSIRKSVKGGFPQSYVQEVQPGDGLKLTNDFEIRVFRARDPYEEFAVMYLIKTPRGNIFHSGDSSYFEEFKKIGDTHKVDVALLNFGKQIPSPEKPYYMDAKKLALASRDLGARFVVPMHWNLWVETREDPGPIKDSLASVAPNSTLVVIDGGQNITL